MKYYIQRTTLLAITLLLFHTSLFAQRSNGIALDGTVSVQEGDINGAYIEMYKDGKQLDNYGIGRSGKYKLELNYNHKYNLIFKREGNFSQKIVVDAHVPKNVLEQNPRFPSFPIDINLFTEIEGIDNSFAENTVLKIYYNKKVDNFISELYYNNAQIKLLIDQAIIQAKMLGEESDYLARLTKAELAELRKEYEALLREADREYNKEEFLNALDGYKAASKVFPKEQYPKDRIAEINDLLGLMMAADELERMLAERFNSLIEKADQLFNEEKYKEAKNEYNRALSIKDDTYGSNRIKEIDEILLDLRKTKEYDSVIASADKLFNQKNWNDARGKYSEALSIKANEQYPKNQINKINAELERLAKIEENNRRYQESIKTGDANFEDEEYQRALLSYQAALEYKPNDAVATQKIKKTQEIIQNQNQSAQYNELIAQADKYFEDKSYSESKINYQNASKIQPSESYPKEQIKKIDDILDREAQFSNLLTQAENKFSAKEYTSSKDLFQQALKIHPDDKDIPKRIEEIDKLIAEQNMTEQYEDIIAQADQKFQNKSYADAKTSYQQALKIKSNEQYPKDQIKEIDTILREIEKTNSAYNKTVELADRQFEAEQYEKAKSTYNNALTIKDEPYPKEMIDKIDDIIAKKQQELAQKQEEEKRRLEQEQEALKARFQQVVDEADALADDNELIAAVGKFREALDIIPNEQYPIRRIEEIRGIIAKQAEADKAYTEVISEADKFFKKKSYAEAKSKYQEAKQIKPSETYPQQQIEKIDALLVEQERLAQEKAEAEKARLAAEQAALDNKYNDAITKADELFENQSYTDAKTNYQTAQKLKPEEEYPASQISKIDELLNQLAATEKAYNDEIKIADELFGKKAYADAKTNYQKAAAIKSDETYPQQQIDRIDAIVAEQERLAQEKAEAEKARLAAEQAALDKKYNDAITKADQLFENQSYADAKTNYQAAQKLKPEEAYPTSQIRKIDELLNQLAVKEKAYNNAIKIADELFSKKSYAEAKESYQKAAAIKSDETYPQQQIDRIDAIVADQERLAQERAEAEKARLAAEQAALDKKYNDAITKADQLFENQSYADAKTNYQAAQKLKPEKAYPASQISKIDELLNQLAATEKAYNDAIKIADELFSKKSYTEAKESYQKAAAIKSDETYPQQQIDKIDVIVAEQERLAQEKAEAEKARLAAEQAALEREYNEAIKKADQLFGNEVYEEALKEFSSAQKIKPDENYPKNQIKKINKIIGERNALAEKQRVLNENYQNFINLADKFFETKDYSSAITHYQKALICKPDEQYPKDRIEISKKLQNQLALEEEYQQIVSSADQKYKATQMVEAKTDYKKALELKPNEQYPKNQIKKIDNYLAIEEAKRKAEKEAAEALALRQQKIKQQKEKIQEKRSESQSEIDAIYNEYIEKADAFFAEKEYNLARAWYYNAWDVKPDEEYPPKKIDEINKIVGSLLNSKAEKSYQEFINKADEALRENQLAVARGWYNRALSFKDNDRYALSQLKEIKALVNKRLSDKSGKKFDEFKEKATTAKEKSEWSIARFWAKQALELQPDNKEMQKFLEEIESELKK